MCVRVGLARQPIRPQLDSILSSFSSIIKLIFGIEQSFDINILNYNFLRVGKKENRKSNKLTKLYLFFCVSSISRWFCHFDDDNYLNVPQLVQLLNEYHSTKSWYLGKPSVASPLEIHLNLVSEIQPHSTTLTFSMSNKIGMFFYLL